jgi:SOUL heme-binding protein
LSSLLFVPRHFLLATMGLVLSKSSPEVPAYSLLAKGDGYVVRSYPSQVAAIYTPRDPCTSAPTQIASVGFRALASYYGMTSAPAQMSAPGKAPELISLTASVLLGYPASSFVLTADSACADKEDNLEQMAFLLPTIYKSVAEAPVPSNPSVSLVQLPARTTAVISFSGNPRPQVVREQAVLLRELLAMDGIVAAGDKPVLACSYPQLTISWLKTNEVLLNVDPVSISPPAIATSAVTNAPPTPA